VSPRKSVFAYLVALAFAASSCEREPTASFGETCDADEVCESGLCVGDGANARRGRCTKSCGPDTTCPEGWSCSALTARGLAVCAQGSGVPDLQLDTRPR
jgi:hypothetical protein